MMMVGIIPIIEGSDCVISSLEISNRILPTKGPCSKVTNHYANCDSETRREIRSIFQKHDSVAWVATFSKTPTTTEGIRRQLLLFSILDQGKRHTGRNPMATRYFY